MDQRYDRPPDIRIRSADANRMTRVILYVRDIARLKVFYETHFGFRTIEEIEGECAVLRVRKAN